MKMMIYQGDIPSLYCSDHGTVGGITRFSVINGAWDGQINARGELTVDGYPEDVIPGARIVRHPVFDKFGEDYNAAFAFMQSTKLTQTRMAWYWFMHSPQMPVTRIKTLWDRFKKAKASFMHTWNGTQPAPNWDDDIAF
jgi:hypothetical protein